MEGGGFILKKFLKFLPTFFSDRLNRFSELSQSIIKTLFWSNLLRRRQNYEKKQAKILTKKSRFFGARCPSNLVYSGTKGALRKFLGSVGQKWISQNSTKRDPLGRQGVKSLRGERGVHPSLPKSAPASCYFFENSSFHQKKLATVLK